MLNVPQRAGQASEGEGEGVKRESAEKKRAGQERGGGGGGGAGHYAIFFFLPFGALRALVFSPPLLVSPAFPTLRTQKSKKAIQTDISTAFFFFFFCARRNDFNYTTKRALNTRKNSVATESSSYRVMKIYSEYRGRNTSVSVMTIRPRLRRN